MKWVNLATTTQLTFTCSKLTIETLEKVVKKYFTPFSSIFIVDFEQVDVSLENIRKQCWEWQL